MQQTNWYSLIPSTHSLCDSDERQRQVVLSNRNKFPDCYGTVRTILLCTHSRRQQRATMLIYYIQPVCLLIPWWEHSTFYCNRSYALLSLSVNAVWRPVHTVRLPVRFFLSQLMGCTELNGNVYIMQLQQHHQSLYWPLEAKTKRGRKSHSVHGPQGHVV